VPFFTRYEITRECLRVTSDIYFIKYTSLSSGTRYKTNFYDRLEIDVLSASSYMDSFYKQVVLREPLVGVVSVFLRYLVSFFTVLVTQLQLCHIFPLDSLQSMEDVKLEM
jgi:hypothetical protein